MSDSSDKNAKLLDKLNELIAKQELLTGQVNSLKNEIENLNFPKTDKAILEPVVIVQRIEQSSPAVNKIPKDSILTKAVKQLVPADFKHNIEKYIGENIISVIGIVILIIGVGIGAKYAFEHQMISPLTRIIFGYLIAIGLLGFAIKLKIKYESYSAVLLSGSLAIMYFLTYAAYEFYDLIPKTMTFGLMVILTMFTTLASIKYNRQVIAHIGFVGAYAVPFLLSDNTGSAAMLLSYLAIINIGILAVSLKKYWKSLYYTAFVFTWLIYLTVYRTTLSATDDFTLLITFLGIFYITFYSVFIAYKIVQKEKFLKLDIILVLANSFIFYGLGYSIFSNNAMTENFVGLFTLLNAVIHFAFSFYIKKQKFSDKNFFYLIVGLVLTFITIAIPVQLNGHWVTLLWIGEATLLFWIGRTKEIKVYEKLSYPLIGIAFFSIFQDWSNVYGRLDSTPENWLTPFFNIQFLSSIFMVIGFAAINYINHKIEIVSSVFIKKDVNKIIQILLPSLFLIILFMTFSLEIANYWDQVYFASSVIVPYEDGSGNVYSVYNTHIKQMGGVWALNYAMFFFTVLSIINYKILKHRLLGLINLGINAFLLVMFLFSGLYLISELRDAYLLQDMAEYFTRGWFYIGIRYVSLMFVTTLVYVSYRYIKQEFLGVNLKQVFAISFYTTILWLLSSELIHWMDFAESTQSYKLGLSILWGVFSLLLIVIGIFRKYKQLRLGAIGLFGITLLKLFFYDISYLNTIAKTIVFMVLGILLLVISFLYNKYKHLIFDESENKD